MNIKEFIESGIIEQYVWGIASPEEIMEVERMSVIYAEIKEAINKCNDALESFALSNSIEPALTVKAFIMATIDYSSRIENGEIPSFPPIIKEDSSVSDYSEWLNREDMVLPDGMTEIYARIIGYTPQVTTAIVWIKDIAPQEVHHDEYEKFLIVEGSCDITIGDRVHCLTEGSVLSIPLYETHSVKITSLIPCKIVLQRIAA